MQAIPSPGPDIRRTIGPLRTIFWGGLICIFDLKINNFDLLHDLVGTIMIAWGVFALGGIKVHESYAKAMRFVQTVVALSCLTTLMDQFGYPRSSFISTLLSLLGTVEMIAIVVFCVAMRWLCIHAELVESTRSWRTTTLLFTFIYLIPLGLFYCAAAIAIATGNSFSIQLGPAGLLLLPVLFAPLVHLFVSTSRMKNEAARDGGAA
ncbi:MAG: hypothetical protein ACR2RV_07855 [Verrucomicrobiales bacterium]